MAKLNNAPRTNNSVSQGNFQRAKADAFLNVSIKTANGEKKVGAIPMNLTKEIHKLMIENAEQQEKFQFVVDMHVVEVEEDLKLAL